MAKSLLFRSHPDEEVLEQYCLNRLDEDGMAPLEEHLLVCEECQKRLADLDVFLKTLRQTGAELREEKYHKPEVRWNGLMTPAWATAGVLAVATLVVVPMVRQPGEPQTVALSLSRGTEEAGIGTASAGRPLNLKLDLTGIPAQNCCLVELVTGDGKILTQASVSPVDSGASLSYAGVLAKGQYWVRVKNSRGDDLREFGLAAR